MHNNNTKQIQKYNSKLVEISNNINSNKKAYSLKSDKTYDSVLADRMVYVAHTLEAEVHKVRFLIDSGEPLINLKDYMDNIEDLYIEYNDYSIGDCELSYVPNDCTFSSWVDICNYITYDDTDYNHLLQ